LERDYLGGRLNPPIYNSKFKKEGDWKEDLPPLNFSPKVPKRRRLPPPIQTIPKAKELLEDLKNPQHYIKPLLKI